MITTQQFSLSSFTEKARTILAWAHDKKGKDLLAFDVSMCHSVTEAVCIISAHSERHARGLADYILEQSKAHNFEFLQMEGYVVSQWILIDLNDVVVHIFLPETRILYQLEDLWRTSVLLADMREAGIHG